MGFRHQPKVYRLVFDDPQLEGLEVRALGMSIGELQDDDLTILAAFVHALQSWNLEDEHGTPLPMTLEALQAYPDADFVSTMTRAWMDAVAGVDEELGKDSPSGKPFPEASIPMEPLSPSLAS